MQCKSPRKIKMKPVPGISVGEEVIVRCGVCWKCRSRRQKLWVGRMLLEQRTQPGCHFVTLTYADLPKLEPHIEAWHAHQGNEVDRLEVGYRDVQLFLKRLRKRFPESTFRYFCAGEHGKLYARPHWHLMIFTDQMILRNLPGKDGVTWESLGLNTPKFPRPVDLITELWGKGYTTCERVIDDVKLRYVTKYMVKEPDRAKFTYSDKLGAVRAYAMGKEVAQHTNEVPSYLRISGRSYPIAGSTRVAMEDGVRAAGLALPATVLDIEKMVLRHERREAVARRLDGDKEETWWRYWTAGRYEVWPEEVHPVPPGADYETWQKAASSGVTPPWGDAIKARHDGLYDYPEEAQEYESERSSPSEASRDSPGSFERQVRSAYKKSRSVAWAFRSGIGDPEQSEPL